MYGPNDVTIPVISRLWKHSTSEDDILSNTRALEVLLQSDHPDHASYIREEGAPSAEQLLGHIYLGVSPKPTSSRESQADAIARTASKHLSMGGEVAHHCLNLLLRLCVLALESTDSSLYLAFRNSGVRVVVVFTAIAQRLLAFLSGLVVELCRHTSEAFIRNS
jgi:hypothetical protein